MSCVGTPSSCRPATSAPLSQVCICRLPPCATAVSMFAVPVPEQSLVDTVHAPLGVDPVWPSNPSQMRAPLQPPGGGCVVVVVVVVGGGTVVGGAEPLQATPFTVKVA